MAKKESTFLNMVITLFLVTLLSALSVGSVYELTKEPKAAAMLAKKTRAVKTVVPDFTNNPIDEEFTIEANGDVFTFYPAQKDGRVIGTAVEAISNIGFGGEIKLLVGFLPEGTINDIAVLDHTETPGLGDKMEKKKSDFSAQFKGKNPKQFNLSVTKDGGDVDAITAATISSRAFCDAVQKAYTVYEEENSK